MFHRRPQRRIIRPTDSLPLGPRRAMAEAALLKEDERYKEAAQIYLRLADAASSRGMVRRSTVALFEAGDCLLRTDEAEHGFALLKQSLQQLQTHRMWKGLHGAGERAVQLLEMLHKPEMAAELRQWLSEAAGGRPPAPAMDEGTAAQQPMRRAAGLPSKCPFCGAGLRSDEVEWIDESYVECPFCGSSVPIGTL